MIIKVGDKIFCKKKRMNWQVKKPINLRNKYYTILEIYDNYITIDTEMPNNATTYILNNHPWARLNIHYEFDDHFLTTNELRIKKLRKLKRIKKTNGTLQKI